MSNTRWLVLEENEKFWLRIRVEPEIRPGRELIWEGRIKVTPEGYASIPRMHLAGIQGEGSLKSEQPGDEGSSRVLRDLIMDNTTNSGSVSDIIQKVKENCERDSQRFEEVLADRARRQAREDLRAGETTRLLHELAQIRTEQTHGEDGDRAGIGVEAGGET